MHGQQNTKFRNAVLEKKTLSQQTTFIITDVSILTQRPLKCLEFSSKFTVLYLLNRRRGTGDIFLGCKQPGCEADQSHHLVS